MIGRGLTLCMMRCGRTADCSLEGEPLCIGCADLVFDRLVAVHLNPRMAHQLPPLNEERKP